MENKARKDRPPTAFDKIAQQETRKGMQVLEQRTNQQVHEQNARGARWSGVEQKEELTQEGQKVD